MEQVLEAVPNFSEGRDAARIQELVDTIAEFDVEVLDWSSDPDHNRSVVTYIGAPGDVEAAAVAAARFAVEHFDLTRHEGVHPRVGALDVLPFVPLHGLTMTDAVASARRVAPAIAELGVPVYYYGRAGAGIYRGLASLRKGGFESLRSGFESPSPRSESPESAFESPWSGPASRRSGWPDGREPDIPAAAVGPHPTAGVTCVGARPVLLAWNVFVSDIDVGQARAVASTIRERDGGFAGLRALGLRLAGQDRLQISMNLEDPDRTSPLAVFDRIKAEVESLGGRVVETEVIGMMTDTLVLGDSVDRLQLPDLGPARVLSHRVANYVSARVGGRTETSEITE